MSLLELPNDTAVPTNVVTVAAALPPAKTGDPNCILPFHVAVVYDAPQSHSQRVVHAATYLQPDYTSLNWRILGVTLDMIPFLDSESSKPKMFSVAVAGLVPVAVPAENLQAAKVGDRLWATQERSKFQFKAGHTGVTFMVDPPEVTKAMRLVGTIYGLGVAGANHCLVLLANGSELDQSVYASTET